jgi:hypothetical protein
MNIEGILHKKGDTEQVSDKFKKREFVLKYAENPLYEQFIKFELIQDRCSEIDKFNPGDSIDVQFNLKGREWTNPEGQKKYFNSLEAWRITKAEGSVSSSDQAVADINNMADPIGAGDDMPF